MKYISTSFDHWKEIVEDTEMKTANLWCEAQFRAQGPKHGKIANIYDTYVQALGAASPYQDKARNL